MKRTSTTATITRRLEELRGDIGAQCIFLTEPAGKVAAQVGDVVGLDVTALASLVAAGYTTTFELARRLGQTRALNLNYQEGARYHLYSSNVGQDLLLVILFGADSPQSRIGGVWLYAKRAIQDLLLLTADLQAATPELVESLEATVWSPPSAEQAEEPRTSRRDTAPPMSNTLTLEEALRLGLIDPDLLDGPDR